MHSTSLTTQEPCLSCSRQNPWKDLHVTNAENVLLIHSKGENLVGQLHSIEQRGCKASARAYR